MNSKIKDITKDLANAIIRGEAMVPICSVGPLLEHIEDLELLRKQKLKSILQHWTDMKEWCTEDEWTEEYQFMLDYFIGLYGEVFE